MDDASVYNTGIVWANNQVPEEKDVFNEPWMDNMDKDLLFRYWKKKGCPGFLYTYISGIKMWHRKIDSVGIISFINMPKW